MVPPLADASANAPPPAINNAVTALTALAVGILAVSIAGPPARCGRWCFSAC
jgi:hypothetical protein